MGKDSTYTVNIGPGNSIGAMAVGPGAVAVGGARRSVIVVCHPNDRADADHIRMHLRVMRTLGVESGTFTTGDSTLSAAMFSADIALLCLSPSLMSSDFFESREWRKATEHEQGDALRIVGVVVRPCFLLGSPFETRANLPRHRTYDQGDRDENGTEVARAVAGLIGLRMMR